MDLLQMNRLGLAATLSIASTAALPAQQTLAPSKRIMVQCDALKTQMGDLTKMIVVVPAGDEREAVTQLAPVAELNAERCLSIHSLLFAYEVIGPGADKQKVGQWVSFRLGQYSSAKTDVEYANKVVALAKTPGVAREAQALRDRLRTVAALTDSLRPR